jgi:D-alanine-D-alanine ligase
MKVAVIYNKSEASDQDVINIFGPQTKEHYNPKTVNKVATALEKGGHNVRVVEGNINVADQLKLFMPRVISGERPGIVFNMAYGIQGNSRYTHIPAMLEMLGVPYVGSGPQAHAVALDKVITKIMLQQRGLPTPPFWVMNSANEVSENVDYHWPVIVKPKMEAVSMGLKIVDNHADLREAVKFVVETYFQEALVEAFIPGREFAVGLLGNGTDLEVLPIVEFDLGGDPNAIQSNEAKLKHPITKVCPSQIDDALAEEIRRLARETFRVLGCNDFARIDLRMDADGGLHILELNSMASLGLTGSYVHAAKVAGYDLDALINRMLDVAAIRYFGHAVPEPSEEENQKTQPLRVRVRTYLRSQITSMTDHLATLVDAHSDVYDTEAINQLTAFAAKKLIQMGFQKQLFPQNEVGNLVYLTNHSEERNGALIMVYLDSPPNPRLQAPFREERGRIYGEGVADKGSLTVLLSALQALRFTRRLKKVKVGILLITDETLGGRYSRPFITDLASRSRHVVGLRPGGLDGSVLCSSSGHLQLTLELSDSKRLRGEAGGDVVSLICQKILALNKLNEIHEGLTLQPLQIQSRFNGGLVAAQVSADLSISYQAGTDIDALIDDIRRITKKNLDSNFQIRVRRIGHRPPILDTEVNRTFFESVEKIATRLEIKITGKHDPMASCIAHAPSNIPILEGLGPMVGAYRTPNEFILRDSLIDRAALLAMVLLNHAGMDGT